MQAVPTNPGWDENCRVQVTLRRQPDGEVAVDPKAAVLSDGATMNAPEMAVVDGHGGREIGIGDVGSLIARITAHRLTEQPFRPPDDEIVKGDGGQPGGTPKNSQGRVEGEDLKIPLLTNQKMTRVTI